MTRPDDPTHFLALLPAQPFAAQPAVEPNTTIKLTISLSFALFSLILLLLPSNPLSMFGDPDTYWHLATGDLIRSHGIPRRDPWSFTAGDYRWLNISWGWDVLMSIVYERTGWHGVIVANSAVFASTTALVFAACFVRSGYDVGSLIVAIIVSAFMLTPSIRPFQFTYLFSALLVLLFALDSRRQTQVPRALLCIPLIAGAWVNLHGGYLITFFLLAVYSLEALFQKKHTRFLWLAGIGALSLLICFLNPYGLDIIEATRRNLTDPASLIIKEWQPATLSSGFLLGHGYLLLFVPLVMQRPLAATRAEKICAYVWLLLGLTTVRHLGIFAILSAPLLALGMQDVMKPKSSPQELSPAQQAFAQLARRIAQSTITPVAVAIASLFLLVSMFSSTAANLYETARLNPEPDLSEEIEFLETHFPSARILTHYNLAGPLIHISRGRIPVFIDGRTITAYPPQVIQDYMAFVRAEPGWEEKILERYRIDGVMVQTPTSANGVYNEMFDRFAHRRGWKRAFTGRTATIFLREPVESLATRPPPMTLPRTNIP